MRKKHRAGRNRICRRMTAWLICLSMFAAILPAELWKEKVFAEEKQGEEMLQNAGTEPKRMSGTEDMASEEILQEPVQQLSEPPAPAFGEITGDTTWTGGSLVGDGTITIKSGVTLTLTGEVRISGEVTINGGGSIKREAEGRFYVENSKVLNMTSIKIDGGSVSARVPVIFGNSNAKILLRECEFLNCVTGTGSGAALWVEGGRTELTNCTFSGCAAGTGRGGAIYVQGGSADLKECNFTDCRGESGGAVYFFRGTSQLTNCRFERCRAGENGGAAYFSYGTVQLTECAFVSCNAGIDGGAIKADYGNALLEEVNIEECSANRAGGGIYVRECPEVKINGGTYQRNSTTVEIGTGKGGGCILNHSSKLYINGGTFSNNTSCNRGGFLYNGGNPGTETYLNGGVFSGNTCTNTAENLGLEGSGAIFCSSNITNPDTVLQLSGTEIFTGGEDGTDGIYLDFSHDLPRYLRISSQLQKPIRVYLNADAASRYVVAKGTASYALTDADREKITFTDLGSSGKKWHILGDAKNNQLILSEFDLSQKFRIIYDSNGAKGTVEDSNEYTILDSVSVRSADSLRYEGRYFREWNTGRYGNGTSYKPGSVIPYLNQNTTLYAIFGKTPEASFYSGENSEAETILAQDVNPDNGAGKLTIPPLKEKSGWEARNWTSSADSVTDFGEIQPGTEIGISSDSSYYGVYRKRLTLTYDANGGDSAPPAIEDWGYANVRDGETVYRFQEYWLASGMTRTDGYYFLEWNTKQDGTGTSYQAGSSWLLKSDMTLYAQWSAEPVAGYAVEHYKQDLTGDGYTKAETEQLTGETGTIAAAMAKSYQGFTENTSHPEQKVSGEITAEGTLTLKLYYDRIRYDIAFDLNGGKGTAPCSQTARYGSLLQEPEEPIREGYFFTGWHKEKEENGKSRWEFDKPVEENTETCAVTLYAGWKPNQITAEYQVEHYKQDLAGDGYRLADTEQLTGNVNTLAAAEPKTYIGFTENTVHPQRIAQGEIAADGSLRLKLYYDRDKYEVKFDLNGGSGGTPQNQFLRYGAYLEETEPPLRTGYSFRGWYSLDGGEEILWNFEKPVEENAASQDVILYAKWVDDIVPVLEKASFQTNCSHFSQWAIRRQEMTITVPITEQGSGVKQADYWLIPSQDEESALLRGSLAQEGFPRYQAVLERLDGQDAARITISEEFRGSILMSCTDHAGNCSKETILTSENGGIIVENHPPEISFSLGEEQNSQVSAGNVTVNVLVEDGGTGTDRRITGGLASVRYQIDKGAEQAVSGEELAGGFVPSCRFAAEISGEGEHFLTVTASDHAGNETVKQIKINRKTSEPADREDSKIEEKDPQKPETREKDKIKPSAADSRDKIKPSAAGAKEKEPAAEAKHQANEPETGENSRTEYWAAIFLLAAAVYLLLGRFCEEEKENS